MPAGGPARLGRHVPAGGSAPLGGQAKCGDTGAGNWDSRLWHSGIFKDAPQHPLHGRRMHFHLVSVTSPQPQGALNKRTFANFPLWTCRDFLNLSPVSPKVFKSFLGLGVGQKMGVRGGARSRSDSWRALPGLPTRVTFSLLSLVEHAGRLPEPKKLEATSGEPPR